MDVQSLDFELVKQLSQKYYLLHQEHRLLKMTVEDQEQITQTLHCNNKGNLSQQWEKTRIVVNLPSVINSTCIQLLSFRFFFILFSHSAEARNIAHILYV
jgi:hypothetical protein